VDTTRDGRRARGVTYLDAHGRRHTVRADTVVLAASAIETARLLLLSRTHRHPHGLGNRSGQLGRNLMFHFFTLGVALFGEDIHAWRGPSTTHTMDDFIGPVTGAAATSMGVPYFKGGICEVGAGVLLIQEAQIYTSLPNGWQELKTNLRNVRLRDRIAAIQLVGEDLAQESNRVDLDPEVRDFHGLPVPRITYSPHRHELAAQRHFAQKLAAVCQATPGAVSALTVAPLVPGGPASDLEGPNSTAHIMGTCRMGTDPRHSVVDAHGRLHEVDNVLIADGSVFASSGGGNPTLTIMATALRTACHHLGHPLRP
jgi:choline dehydrogenase-like flavoprotein